MTRRPDRDGHESGRGEQCERHEDRARVADDIGVAGVQFRFDAVPLGAEDHVSR
jgi:hypothetical protein